MSRLSVNTQRFYIMKSLLLSLAALAFSFSVSAQTPKLARQGTATQLIVSGEPYLILGGELSNSAASSAKDIETAFLKLHRMGLNTVFTPAYWDLIEPAEGTFDFTLIDKAINEARKDSLHIVILWFGAWKNSMSCYTPEWFKKDYRRFPRAYTAEGKPMEIASCFSDNVLKADQKAFARLMNHIKDTDASTSTVLMMQVENEIGMLESARDHSETANKLFDSEVPSSLISYLKKHKKTLHPDMLHQWEKNGYETKGTWTDIFGNDVYTDEIFMAYYYAQYVEKLAKTARGIYNIPLYVNAAMNSRNRKPGEYPSAGPLAHLIDVWHCGAPSIDILAPDIYDTGFKIWASKYKQHNNPFFTPEVRLSEDCGVRAFYVFGALDGISFSPFAIDESGNMPKLEKAYNKLKELTPLITANQGTGNMHGLLFDKDDKESIFDIDGTQFTCRHYFTLPWDARAKDGSTWPEGGGLIIRLASNDYVIAGSGIVVSFDKADKQKSQTEKVLGEDGFIQAGGKNNVSGTWEKGASRIGIASVDEVNINADGTLKYVRRLNGDQDHQGRHARISVDDFEILHVKLYEYK